MQQSNGGDKQNTQQGGLSWSITQPQKQANVQKSVMPAQKAPAAGPSTGTYIGLIVVGIVVGILAAWAYSAMRSPDTETASTTSTSTSQTSNTASTGTQSATSTSSGLAAGSDPSLTVMSPQKPGTSVAIYKAIVSSPTWVVVYENNNGKPGNALGAALFFPDRQAGTVELLRATVSGKSYLLAKQTDNGDRKFSLKNDPFLTENGEIMWVTVEVR